MATATTNTIRTRQQVVAPWGLPSKATHPSRLATPLKAMGHPNKATVLPSKATGRPNSRVAMAPHPNSIRVGTARPLCARGAREGGPRIGVPAPPGATASSEGAPLPQSTTMGAGAMVATWTSTA